MSSHVKNKVFHPYLEKIFVLSLLYFLTDPYCFSLKYLWNTSTIIFLSLVDTKSGTLPAMKKFRLLKSPTYFKGRL